MSSLRIRALNDDSSLVVPEVRQEDLVTLPDQSERLIYKYVMDVPDKVLPLADTDEILSAGMQEDQIVVWAVRDKAKYIKRGRRVVCLNTGVEAPPVIRRCIGTVTSSAGIVWHVLEVTGA